ncbi:unnamed protein product [Cylicocyclus nassatus]|uniref:Uncharacterized protein n=1 Tax=Cylicocyclus nassatus TaxID=53992 RepID=A0AA36GIW8_CYLNA|nr:unnamed protein product [Cylicocyclus nassatus]
MHPPQLRVVLLIGVHLVHGATSYLEVDEKKLKEWAQYGIDQTKYPKEKPKNPSKDQENDHSNEILEKEGDRMPSKNADKNGDASNSISKNGDEGNSISGKLSKDPSKQEENSVFKDYHVSLNTTKKESDFNVLRNNHSEELQENPHKKEEQEENTNLISENDPEDLPRHPDDESEVSIALPGDDDDRNYDYDKERENWNEWAQNYSEKDEGWGTTYGVHLILGPPLLLRERWPWGRGGRRRNRFRNELK